MQPSAFETLRKALEKHQSEERLPSESDLYEGRASVPPSMPSQAVVSRRATTSARGSQHNPFTSPPVGSSVLHPTSDNPYPTTSAPQIQISASRGTGGSSTQQSSPTSDGINTHLSSSTPVAQRTHDVPGEVWIDPLEREGLPVHAPIPNANNRREGSALRRRSTWARGSRDDGATSSEKHIERLAEHQAAGVVRAHTRRGWGWLHRSHNGRRGAKSKGTRDGERGKMDQGPSVTDEKGKATRHSQHHRRHTHSDTENDADFAHGELRRPGRVRQGVPGSWLAPVTHLPHMHTRHPEDYHHGHAHGPNLGNGVLSALLALYGHDHEHDDEGSVSGGSTPGGRSRASSDAGSEDGILPKPDRPWLSDEHDHHEQSTSKNVKGKHAGKFSLGRSVKGGSASSILAHLRTPSLPAASTTAALIAGAGTLSGAAAPQQATLAPNLKKAGYSLVRYSVEEVPKTVSRTPNIISRTHRYTRSTDSGNATNDHRESEKESEPEYPDTPAATIVVSPTGGSEGVVDDSKGVHDHPASTPGGRRGWTDKLMDLPLPIHFTPSHLRALSSFHEKGLHTSGGSGTATPGTASAPGTSVEEFDEKKDYFDLKHTEKETRRIKEQEKKEREKQRRRKRRKAEVYVRHPFSSIPPVY